MKTKLLIVLVVVALVIVGGVAYLYSTKSTPAVEKTVTQETGNGSTLKNEIVVDYPADLEEIRSPVEVAGNARGNWFFEASFPAEIQDSNGKILGTGVMTANGEWMTENFVPFVGSIVFQNSETPEGKLVIKKDNPSGLPENDKSLIIPIKFGTPATD